MNNDLVNTISSVNWQHYLSRPFNLFQTSVWNKWYDSQEIADLLGVRLIKGFFAEYPKGMVKHYREDRDMNAMYASIRNIAERDLSLSEKLLDEGIEKNEKIKKLISEKSELGVNEALKLCIEVALVGTIFPYFAGDVLLKKYGEESTATKKAIALRATSYYPQIFSELLIPAVKRELSKRYDSSADLFPYILIDELQSDIIIEKIKERKNLSDNGQQFIYFSDHKNKTVIYTSESRDYLKLIDPRLFDTKTEIKGMVGNAGKAKGKVRHVLTNDLSKIVFNTGEILVAVSTNPILVPIMQRAGAIITDEGGALCHAAIVSRELKIPCVVGTKIATQLLKDGDEVEVDADKGIVKII